MASQQVFHFWRDFKTKKEIWNGTVSSWLGSGRQLISESDFVFFIRLKITSLLIFGGDFSLEQMARKNALKMRSKFCNLMRSTVMKFGLRRSQVTSSCYLNSNI